MAIDKSLRQEYEDQDYGLNKVLKYVSADKDNGYWRDKKNLPINVIPFPFKKSFKEELEEMEKERKRLEKDKKTGTKIIKRLAERSTPPGPYGTETFGWPEYEDYLDKLKPGAVPLSFPQFMDQLDLSPQDFFGKAPESEEGLLSLITPTQRKEIMGMIKAFININKERA